MQGFEDVKISWAGAEYTVPANRQLLLIASIEDALSSGAGKSALQMLMQEGGPSTSRLAMAYGAALRFAGASVSDDEIYLSIMEDMAQKDISVAVKIQSAIMALISIIAPPIARELAAPDDDEKKPQAAE